MFEENTDGYVAVPAHLVRLFNKVFDEELKRVHLVVSDDFVANDKNIWIRMVAARDSAISDYDEDDERSLENKEKITWH